MPLSIDYFNSVISVTSPTTDVSAQELADFIEDEMATPVGTMHGDIIKPEGKIEDPTNPGIFSQIILIFNSPWQVQFWQGSGYTRLFGGKFVGGLNDKVLKATGAANDISVLESPVDGVTTVVSTGSGLSAAQDTKLTTVHGELTNIEGIHSHGNIMRGIWAMLAGHISGAEIGAAGTAYITDMMNNKIRITMEFDNNGNRTLVMFNDLT